MTKPLILAVIEHEGITATLNSDGKWESMAAHFERYLNLRFNPTNYSSALMSGFKAATLEASRVTGAKIKKLDEGEIPSDAKDRSY